MFGLWHILRAQMFLRSIGKPHDFDDAMAHLRALAVYLQTREHVTVAYSPTRDSAC